ncbi:hypothetical protein [Saccharothrix syringae]|uniref:Lipoprotein n=1 Tax=Saccharothrix syringae TaxID=103733 RepID=A0A5Q0H8E7_SACSY|nr:hypothetical protein [Saccharothrix syringae]QFZ22185.1 hypothetical protein EKG83_36500 [Saccharothrix syringae]
MKRCLMAVLVLVLTGCGTSVAGKAVPGPTSQAAAPDAEVLRWVNNFCGVADYMVASGGVQFDQVETDPAKAKQSLSEMLGRTVDMLNVVLHDLDELTPAPDPAADTAVEVIQEPLARAHEKFAKAKSTVDGAPELTLDVYSAVLQDMTEAVSVMNDAVGKINVVSLPDEFTAAARQAENCS